MREHVKFSGKVKTLPDLGTPLVFERHFEICEFFPFFVLTEWNYGQKHQIKPNK